MHTANTIPVAVALAPALALGAAVLVAAILICLQYRDENRGDPRISAKRARRENARRQRAARRSATR